MPLLAPVTNAILPSSLPMACLLQRASGWCFATAEPPLELRDAGREVIDRRRVPVDRHLIQCAPPVAGALPRLMDPVHGRAPVGLRDRRCQSSATLAVTESPGRSGSRPAWFASNRMG